MKEEDVLETLNIISKNNGFDYVKYIGEYKGEDIYKPSFYDDDVLYGRPCFLHVKRGRIRRISRIRRSKNHSEVSKIIKHFWPRD